MSIDLAEVKRRAKANQSDPFLRQFTVDFSRIVPVEGYDPLASQRINPIPPSSQREIIERSERALRILSKPTKIPSDYNFLKQFTKDLENLLVGVSSLAGGAVLFPALAAEERVGPAMMEAKRVGKSQLRAGVRETGKIVGELPSVAGEIGKGIIKEYETTIKHPIKSFKERPISTLLNIGDIAVFTALATKPTILVAKALIDSGRMAHPEAVRVLGSIVRSEAGFARFSTDDLDNLLRRMDDMLEEGQVPTPDVSPILRSLSDLSERSGLTQSQIFGVATSTYRPTGQMVTLDKFLAHPLINRTIRENRELKDLFTDMYNQIRALPESEIDSTLEQLNRPIQEGVGTAGGSRYLEVEEMYGLEEAPSMVGIRLTAGEITNAVEIISSSNNVEDALNAFVSNLQWAPNPGQVRAIEAFLQRLWARHHASVGTTSETPSPQFREFIQPNPEVVSMIGRYLSDDPRLIMPNYIENILASSNTPDEAVGIIRGSAGRDMNPEVESAIFNEWRRMRETSSSPLHSEELRQQVRQWVARMSSPALYIPDFVTVSDIDTLNNIIYDTFLVAGDPEHAVNQRLSAFTDRGIILLTEHLSATRNSIRSVWEQVRRQPRTESPLTPRTPEDVARRLAPAIYPPSHIPTEHVSALNNIIQDQLLAADRPEVAVNNIISAFTDRGIIRSPEELPAIRDAIRSAWEQVRRTPTETGGIIPSNQVRRPSYADLPHLNDAEIARRENAVNRFITDNMINDIISNISSAAGYETVLTHPSPNLRTDIRERLIISRNFDEFVSDLVIPIQSRIGSNAFTRSTRTQLYELWRALQNALHE